MILVCDLKEFQHNFANVHMYLFSNKGTPPFQKMRQSSFLPLYHSFETWLVWVSLADLGGVPGARPP